MGGASRPPRLVAPPASGPTPSPRNFILIFFQRAEPDRVPRSHVSDLIWPRGDPQNERRGSAPARCLDEGRCPALRGSVAGARGALPAACAPHPPCPLPPPCPRPAATHPREAGTGGGDRGQGGAGRIAGGGRGAAGLPATAGGRGVLSGGRGGSGSGGGGGGRDGFPRAAFNRGPRRRGVGPRALHGAAPCRAVRYPGRAGVARLRFWCFRRPPAAALPRPESGSRAPR